MKTRIILAVVVTLSLSGCSPAISADDSKYLKATGAVYTDQEAASAIARAHSICAQLDDGVSMKDVMTAYDSSRLREIGAAVGVYCTKYISALSG